LLPRETRRLIGYTRRGSAKQDSIYPGELGVPDPIQDNVTQILLDLQQGNPEAANRLIVVLYDELRALAASYLLGESPGHSLPPTALVHEAYLRMVDQSRVQWQGRGHFLAVAAHVMRRVLVDHARAKKRAKRGGDRQRIEWTEEIVAECHRDIDLLEIDDALSTLAERDPRQATIVELRFFGGLGMEEIARVLGVSKRTVEAEWTMIRAWLRRELARED